MTRLVGIACATAVALSTVQALAGNLEKPDYPLNAVEQLYADLYKLPPEERLAKIIEGAKKEEKLEHIQTVTGVLGRGITGFFREAYPFVKHAQAELGSQQAIERIVQEERASKHLTDVSGGDLTELSEALEKGFLARYPTPVSERALPQYRVFQDPHNRWLAYQWSEQGISYNSRMIKLEDAPKTWFDLCDPKYKGEVSFEPTRTRFLIFLYNMLGEQKMVEWMTCMGNNEPILMRGQSARVELMLAGDHAIQGTNFFYYGLTLVEQKGADRVPFKAVYSAPLAANGSGCLINRHAPHPFSAALWCDTLMGEKTQKHIRDGNRGAITMQHRFIPSDVELVSTGPMSVEMVNKLNKYWLELVAKRKV